MHAIVSQLYELHPFDTSQVTVFNVDELAGLPRSYKGSCYAMIKSQICQPLHIKEENFKMCIRDRDNCCKHSSSPPDKIPHG